MPEQINQPDNLESSQARILEINNQDPEVLARAERNGPSTLDVVRIDGRWAQTFTSGDPEISLRWLDDNAADRVDLEEYALTKLYDSHVGMFQNLFTDEQFKNIHWESGFTTDELRRNVTIFGEYSSKQGDKRVEK